MVPWHRLNPVNARWSVLLARPFVKSWVTLFVAVPLAALAGVLILGGAALVVALLLALAGSGDVFDWSSGPSGSSTGKKKRHQDLEQGPLASPE